MNALFSGVKGAQTPLWGASELIAASIKFEPLGEVGANFSLQLSSRTQFAKINDKKSYCQKSM